MKSHVARGVRILVCVKQVLDSAETVSIDETATDETATWIRFEPGTVFRMNRFDEFAVQEALRIRESIPGSVIDALSLGPDRVKKTILKALEMGADNGVHIPVETKKYILPYMRASMIAEYAQNRHYDLILTGIMAEDDMECQVGQLLAGILGLPYATSVIYQDIEANKGTIYVEKEIEEGRRECMDIDLPALITVQSGINTPGYPSLSNVLRARGQQIEVMEPSRCADRMDREVITGVSYPSAGVSGTFIDGSPQEKANALLDILHKNAVL
ncbi:MAG: electron transfer flavoprotein subunit beta/FixA family protein [Thermodesulfobacteriota bacterium]|nr:electron transfer flavoprotein subunit beta/FixA family protein [Thermodesulfobacteriota bacterium]